MIPPGFLNPSPSDSQAYSLLVYSKDTVDALHRAVNDLYAASSDPDESLTALRSQAEYLLARATATHQKLQRIYDSAHDPLERDPYGINSQIQEKFGKK